MTELTTGPEDVARTLRGSCGCGAVPYAVEDAFEYAANCHCGGCRRATGSAFKPFGGVRREKLALATGADALLRVGNPEVAHDVRCARCGSLLFPVVREGHGCTWRWAASWTHRPWRRPVDYGAGVAFVQYSSSDGETFTWSPGQDDTMQGGRQIATDASGGKSVRFQKGAEEEPTCIPAAYILAEHCTVGTGQADVFGSGSGDVPFLTESLEVPGLVEQ